jgi:hypothetical protein
MPLRARASAPALVEFHSSHQGLPIGGQTHHCLSRAAVEEEYPELALEQPDLAAERGLRQVQPGRRPGEALLFGHGEHIVELAQLHATDSTGE